MHRGWEIETWAVCECSNGEDLLACLNRADVLLTKSRPTQNPMNSAVVELIWSQAPPTDRPS